MQMPEYRPQTSKKSNKSLLTLQQNLQKMSSYLAPEDHQSLKLTCRAFYYHFITAQIWLGLKLTVAQEKLQYLEDIEFEVEAETKHITRKDKNIRIHSLKKQVQDRVRDGGKGKGGVRDMSNFKEKGRLLREKEKEKEIQGVFRNTEIGFKRLLKTNSKKRVEESEYEVKEWAELPKISKLQDYIIKISDPWSSNMNKAQNLITLFKSLNQFQHKLLTHLKLPTKDLPHLPHLPHLILKLKNCLEPLQHYTTTTSTSPYPTIIQSTQGSKQNMLIDENLNKVCKLFWNNHMKILSIQMQVVGLVELFEKFWNGKMFDIGKLGKFYSLRVVEEVSNLDQAVEGVLGWFEGNRELGGLMFPQVVAVFLNAVEGIQTATIVFQDTGEETRVDMISWGIISRKPFFFETLLQILASLTSKIIKHSSTTNPDDLTLSIPLSKLKNIKSVSQSLLSIAKYLGKIKKQMQDKEKKGKTPDSIRQFLAYYESKDEESLYLTKNTSKLDKIIAEFKEHISNMKSQIQAN